MSNRRLSTCCKTLRDSKTWDSNHYSAVSIQGYVAARKSGAAGLFVIQLLTYNSCVAVAI